MDRNRQLRVTLSAEMAQLVESKVASGEYADAGEVVEEGLRTLQARDHATELWLEQEVVPAAGRLEAAPDRALGIDQLRRHLSEKRNRTRSGAA